MKSISKLKDSEKFDKFINECTEFSQSIDGNTNITKSFPRFILSLYFNLSKDKIEEALRGLGSDDDGLDAFFISEDEKKIYLIQFKSKRIFDEVKDGKKEWFVLLNTFVERISASNFQPRNHRIIEIREQIKEDLLGYSQELYIFHLGNTSSTIESSFSNIAYYSQKEILEKFVQYYEADLSNDNAPEEIEMNIRNNQSQDFNNQNNYIYFTPKAKNGKTRKTVVFPISGEQIIDLINQGPTILERNVRGYLGDSNTVNKGIIKTALESPEYFYFFNNGISITCDELIIIENNKSNLKIKLLKPQIINGAQTVNSLYSAYKIKEKCLKNNNSDNKEALEHMKKINVLCKVMESNKHINTSFAKEVTQYSNTQNKIKPTDFYANRPEQIVIKEEILKYGITYNIKRGKNFEHKKGYFINMEDLGENHYAQTEEPFFAKASSIFVDNCENDERSSYTKIFSNNGTHNSKRTMGLAKTFFIYNTLLDKLNYVKKVFNEISLLVGKGDEEIKCFMDENKDFFKITGARKYFDDVIKQKNEVYTDSVSKYIFIMDFKILSYIIREIMDKHKVLSYEDNDEKEISILFENYIISKNILKIESLVQISIKQALKLYGKAIEEIFKENANMKIQKKHSKNKNVRAIIEGKISEYISNDEYDKFDF